MVCGSWQKPTFYLQQKDIRFEASTLDTPAQHLFLTEMEPSRTRGLCYQCDNCKFVSCAESSYEPLVNLRKAWSVLHGGEETENVGSANKDGEEEGEAVD